MIKPLYIRSGKSVVTQTELYFFDDLKSISPNPPDLTGENAWKKNIEFIHYKKPKDGVLFEKYDITDIKSVFYRNFLSKNSSAEIFFSNNTTILLFFPTSDERDSFCKQIYKNRDKKEQSKNFLVTNGKKSFKSKKFLDKWMNWEISTFEYLMNVNIYANRGFNDISHYPVFPWLHVNSEGAISIKECLRDLTKNMGKLGSKDRIEELIRKYEEGDCFEDDKYHYGSHYSHPGIVLHYLIRLHPFTEGCLALQDGQFDVADRLFFSIPHAIENALNDISDVREVIPEFFFSPDMFLHMNGIDLGEMQNGKKVKDVILPNWANNDPHFYVHELKRVLESEEVSFTINEWIDYIYGYKQRGQEAVDSLNVYPHYTYDKTQDSKEQEENAKERGIDVSVSQAYNFGQTPSQIFEEAHKSRYPRRKALKYNLITDFGCNIRPYRPVEGERKVLIFYSKIVGSKIYTLTRDKTIKTFNLKSKTATKSPFTIEASFEKPYPPSYTAYLEASNLKDNTFQILDEAELLLGKGTHIVRGGLYKKFISGQKSSQLCNGIILVCTVETGKMSFIEGHSSPVTCLAVDEKDKLCVSGSKKGDVIFWEIGTDKHEWTVKYHFYNHEDLVTSVNITDSIVLTSSLDSSVNMYNHDGKLLRTFYHPQKNPVLSAVYSNAPLPCVVFYSFRDKKFYSFSVNGKLLGSCSEDINDPLRGIPKDAQGYQMIRAPKVVPDSYFNDHLVYGTDRGTVLIRALPYLDKPRFLLVAADHSTLSLLVSPDRRFLLAGTTVGGLRVLTDPRTLEDHHSTKEISYKQVDELTLSRSASM